MKFDYLQRVVIESQLDVENIGQCVISANNDFGEEYYLIIVTVLGWTEVIEYGPATPDIQILPFNVSSTYSRFEYNQSKLEKIIDRFLNNPKRGITQATVVELEDIRNNIVNPVDKIGPHYEDE